MLSKDGRIYLTLPKIGVKTGKEMNSYLKQQEISAQLNTSRHQSRKLQGLFKVSEDRKGQTKVILEAPILTPIPSNEVVTTQNRSFSQGSLLKQQNQSTQENQALPFTETSRTIFLEPLKTTRETQVSSKEPRVRANLKVLLK